MAENGAVLMGCAPVPVLPDGNVMDNGAMGDGITDDTAAIYRTLARITASRAATSGGRLVSAPLYFPAGYTFKYTSDLVWQSVINPVIVGYGATLLASGTNFTKAGLLVDGAYRAVIRGLTFAGDGTEQVPSAFKLDNSTAGFEVTTGCSLADVTIAGMKYVTGLDLSGTGARQLDGCQFDNVLVAGQQGPGAWSSSGNWQNGILLGNGTFGNNYDHCGRGLQCAGHYTNYNVNVSSLSIDGAQPANGFLDFSIVPGAQCSFRNIQSQNANQLLAVSGFAPIPVTLEDIDLKSVYLNASSYIAQLTGGMVRLKNIGASNLVNTGGSSYVTGVVSAGGDGAGRPCTLSVDQLCAYGLKTAAIVPVPGAGQANIVCANYANYNPNTGQYTTVAGDVLSAYSGTSWTNLV